MGFFKHQSWPHLVITGDIPADPHKLYDMRMVPNYRVVENYYLLHDFLEWITLVYALEVLEGKACLYVDQCLVNLGLAALPYITQRGLPSSRQHIDL
jgi:hypothetical protein